MISHRYSRDQKRLLDKYGGPSASLTGSHVDALAEQAGLLFLYSTFVCLCHRVFNFKSTQHPVADTSPSALPVQRRTFNIKQV